MFLTSEAEGFQTLFVVEGGKELGGERIKYIFHLLLITPHRNIPIFKDLVNNLIQN